MFSTQESSLSLRSNLVVESAVQVQCLSRQSQPKRWINPCLIYLHVISLVAQAPMTVPLPVCVCVCVCCRQTLHTFPLLCFTFENFDHLFEKVTRPGTPALKRWVKPV